MNPGKITELSEKEKEHERRLRGRRILGREREFGGNADESGEQCEKQETEFEARRGDRT